MNRQVRSLRAALAFVTPLLALMLLWAVLVRAFQVDPRVFPDIVSVARAGIDSIRDGSLLMHAAASLARVAIGTALALLISIPLGVAMGVSPAIIQKRLEPAPLVVTLGCWIATTRKRGASLAPVRAEARGSSHFRP